jgi:deoxyribodipyrimidine photo-lyase
MVIYWHKRDMRLLDNQALTFAVNLSQENSLDLLPIMGLETDLIQSPETAYEFDIFTQFGLLSSMLPLYKNYQHFGVNSIIFHEPVLEILDQIHNKKSIKYLISHQENGTNGTYKRDKEVQNFCKKNNIIWQQIQPSLVIRNLKSRDQIPKEYLTSKLLPVPNFNDIKETLDSSITLKSENTFKLLTKEKKQIQSSFNLHECSEKIGHSELSSFVLDRARGYRGGISSPNSAIIFGSRLSQFLAYGSLSLRYIYQHLWANIKSTDDKKLKSGMLGAMQRLHWREHFVQRIETEPNMSNQAIHPDFNNIQYTHNLDYFEKYKTGKTGEVLIDACIRCLLNTGFINFRMRALLVSYGVFGLDLDWRQLGRFLATVFLDYEPGIHWSQIQMQAGVTGINTIRVYSPHKQLLDQDPNCIFVRKWLPEITNLTNEQILNYPNISLFSITDGEYPDPIVDFKSACKTNKAKTFGARKKSSKEASQKVFTLHGSRKKRPAKKSTKAKLKIENITKGLFD